MSKNDRAQPLHNHTPNPTTYGTELALRALGQTLRSCTSVTWPTSADAVLCQKPVEHVGRHSAQTHLGIIDWGEPTEYRHFPEVVSGECDPDLEHDVARESRDEDL